MGRFIELVNFTNISLGQENVEQIMSREIHGRGADTFAVCDFGSLQAYPDYCRMCYAKKILPVYGVVFKVAPPNSSYLDVFCYAKDEEGVEDIYRIYNSMEHRVVELDTLIRYSHNIYVGFYLCDDDLTEYYEKISETCLKPDFIFVDRCFAQCPNWREKCSYAIENGIMICATTSCFFHDDYYEEYSYEASEIIDDDEVLMKDFEFLGPFMEDALFTNPRKIAGFGTSNQNVQESDIYDYDIIPRMNWNYNFRCLEVISELCRARIIAEFGSSDGFVAYDRYLSELKFIEDNDAGMGFLAARVIAGYCRENGLSFSAGGVFGNSFAAWLLGILDECPIDPQLHCELFFSEVDFQIEVPVLMWRQLPKILEEELPETYFVFGSEIKYREEKIVMEGACDETTYLVRTHDSVATDVIIFGEKGGIMPLVKTAGCQRTHFDYRDYLPCMRLMVKYLPMQD